MSARPEAPASAKKPRHQRSTPVAERGEPYVWLTGCGLAAATLMIATLLVLVTWNGVVTFWPRGLAEIELTDGSRLAGEISRSESYRPRDEDLAAMGDAVRRRIAAAGGLSKRHLVRTGNYDLYGDDFKWVTEAEIAAMSWPTDLWLVERLEWGLAIARPERLLSADAVVADGAGAALTAALADAHPRALANNAAIRRLERDEIGDVNYALERSRLAVKRAALRSGVDSAAHRAAIAKDEKLQAELKARYGALEGRLAALRAGNSRDRLVLRDVGGRLIPERPATPDTPLLLAQVVRAYPANDLSLSRRVAIYLSRWKEFVSSEPREANTEGGVFPAIFGTFMMTVMLSLVVAPFGVMAALYLREYARQGFLVSGVRVAVNNLAGVPSIVYGVFGLGFFCYGVGGRIDQLFFSERLPAPTFGTGGILWASLTLALLTVPVVIVATEEALAAVPRSMREGSIACGATRWQTLRRIVLPAATPGILTGLILAMARGAGEVAPLMLTGVVKLAPALPFDGHFPYLHLERSFMHLGFHIYDVGFQSRNSEAGKPMVYTTTLLLIALIAALNLTAVILRARLKRRYRTAQF